MNANELGIDNVGGVFVVLLGGMCVAVLIAFGEFIWKSRKLAHAEHVSRDSLIRWGRGKPQKVGQDGGEVTLSFIDTDSLVFGTTLI